MSQEQIFMQYICKNCDKIYLDKDVKGRRTPIKGYYCPECVEKYGFINPPFLAKKKLSKKQKEVLQKNKFHKRKKSSISKENNYVNINGGKNEY